jgi:tRNA C32,U32 (ribose-2'-O)-methylase TrmJ
MTLNIKYYNTLINKYSIQKNCNKTVYLSTVAIIMDNYRRKNVCFNFPKGYDLKAIINMLYENFSKDIFANHADITDYSIGNKLKRTGEKGKNVYVIVDIKGQDYFLTKEKDNSNLKIKSTFDKLKRNYTQIRQSTRNSTLQTFIEYFESVNKYDFTPQHFLKKIVLIAGQTIWNNLTNKNCIPSIYLPNTREGEQTIRKSLEALEDCIAYITPKYEVCYEEILRKNITIDTIIVCDTDLNFLSQVIQDQSIFNFKLIVLSNKSEIQKNNKITLWNWQKEEIELLESKGSNNIEIDSIEDEELDNLIQYFEDCMKDVSSFEYPIKLKSYGYFLRLALNALQDEQFDYLLMRLKNNKELERNEGGYEDFADKNPKEALKNLISYLKKHNPKWEKINETIRDITKKALIIAEREDVDCFKTIRNNNCKVITNVELKKLLKNSELHTKTLVFYSFNGAKDFEFIYNLSNNVRLILYKQEKDFYCKQLHDHSKQLEEELTSNDRFAICSIKYEPIIKPEIKISPTLEQIIERLDQRSDTAYEGYKIESDSLLDDLEEEINYHIAFNDNSTVDLVSNETVFDEKGNLIKSYRLKIGGKIRIYPKELAENLFQIAIEVEPDKFGKIDEHSNAWKNTLKELDNQFDNNRDRLYQKLKDNGLRVRPETVDSYFREKRKFPMYNSDLKAILSLANKESILSEIKKSKRLYNSTMIALGRGVKQELQQFLKNKTIGEILQKKGFTADALQEFINKYMPLLTITKIEERSDEQQ